MISYINLNPNKIKHNINGKYVKNRDSCYRPSYKWEVVIT